MGWEQKFPDDFALVFHFDLNQSYRTSWRDKLTAEMPHADAYQIFF